MEENRLHRWKRPQCQPRPYLQVGDLTLHNRVVELIRQEKLVAEGDIWDIWGCCICLAQEYYGSGVWSQLH